MGDKGSFRDWQIYSSLTDFHKDSYDFIGRCLELENGVSAPFLRYRDQNNLVEVFFYSEEGYEDVMDDLRSVRSLLDSEAFDPRLNVTSTDNTIKDEDVSLGGDYYFDASSDMEKVSANLDSIVASNIDELDLIYRID